MLAAALALAIAATIVAPASSEPPSEAAPICEHRDLSLEGLGSNADDLGRLAELSGRAPLSPRLIRRLSGETPVPLCAAGAPPQRTERTAPDRLEATLVPATSFSRLLTGWSDDRNDGALFAGRGLSSSLSAGLRLRWRWLTAQLAPLAAWQSNLDFPRRPPAAIDPGLPAGYSPYANPFNQGAIDLPLRYGPRDFWTFDWGQSFLRADAMGLAAGLSTENLWWGPGVRNTLLMTNSAAGFPHLFVGTSAPTDVWIGKLEAEVLWGRLRESPYFDADPTNDRRLFEALVLSFEPAFAPGLYLGYARVFLFPSAYVSGHHYFDPLVQPLFKVFLKRGSDDGTRPDNQLLSLFFRWVFPQSQLEFYGELGRDDHAFAALDLLEEPGHSAAWVVGLQKLFPAGRRWVRFQVEAAHTFEMPPNHPTRATPIFYTHGVERQGYTERGQMLGAGIGPQADTQLVAADWLLTRGRVGLWVERLVRNERFFYDVYVPSLPEKTRHDLQMTYGLRAGWSWREWDVEGHLGIAHRYNLDFNGSRAGADALLRVSYQPGRLGPLRFPGIQDGS